MIDLLVRYLKVKTVVTVMVENRGYGKEEHDCMSVVGNSGRATYNGVVRSDLDCLFPTVKCISTLHTPIT